MTAESSATDAWIHRIIHGDFHPATADVRAPEERHLKPAARLPIKQKEPAFYGSSPYLDGDEVARAEPHGPRISRKVIVRSRKAVSYDDLLHQYRVLSDSDLKRVGSMFDASLDV